jgi:AhpD family alkylhydroperoxidase
MESRLDYAKAAPEGALKAMMGLEHFVSTSGLEKPLLELVRLRASQINGCAYCIDMHTKDARAANETEQRLNCVSVWKETPFYTERERAALEWTETLTRIADNEVSDEVFNRVRRFFTDSELVSLTLAVVAINGWNRIAKPFRSTPGVYQPAARQHQPVG